jgi:hypothetical protein
VGLCSRARGSHRRLSPAIFLLCSCHTVQIEMTAVKSATRGFCDMRKVRGHSQLNAKYPQTLTPGCSVCNSNHINMHKRMGCPNTPNDSSKLTGFTGGAVIQIKDGHYSVLYRRFMSIQSSSPISVVGWPSPKSIPVNPAAELHDMQACPLFQISLDTKCNFDCIFFNEGVATCGSSAPSQRVEPCCRRSQGRPYFDW